MWSSMLALAVAAGMSGAAHDSASSRFDAVLIPAATSREATAEAMGNAKISASSDHLAYHVQIVNLPHVTDVALVDEGRAVDLASPGDTRNASVELQGSVSATQVTGVPFGQLVQDMQQGKTEIVVFTTNEPGGAISGTVKTETRLAPMLS